MDLKVRDVMTTVVVTVEDSAPFKDVVRLMDERRVSALPVVDADGRLVGIASEADLLLKEEYEPVAEPARPRFERRRRRIEREKALGLVAADVMTSPVVTVGTDATIREAARLMHERSVKRLPVVDAEGRLIGIVSRADLLKVFLRPDQEILDDVTQGVLRRTLWLEPGTVEVEVRNGVVRLQGVIEQRSMIPVVVALVKGVDGVVAVDNRLEYAVDDVSRSPAVSAMWGSMPEAYRWP